MTTADAAVDNPRDASRIILALDADCFYVQCARLLDARLYGKPVAVSQKSLLVSVSYEARAAGVPKMAPVAAGREALPSLVVVPGEDLTWPRNAGTALYDFTVAWMADAAAAVAGAGVVAPAAPVAVPVERLQQEELFVDVTGLVESGVAAAPTPAHGAALAAGAHSEMLAWLADERAAGGGHVWYPPSSSAPPRDDVSVPVSVLPRRWQAAAALAAALRRGIARVTGLALTCGIAPSKLTAKLVGATHKPNDQTVLLPADVAGFMAPRPLASLTGIGRVTTARLDALHCVTVSDLLRVPLAVLQAALAGSEADDGAGGAGDTAAPAPLSAHVADALGDRVLTLARGEDVTPVTPPGLPAAYSEEDTYRARLTSWAAVSAATTTLAAQLLQRADDDTRRYARYPRACRIAVCMAPHTATPADAFPPRVTVSVPLPAGVLAPPQPLVDGAAAPSSGGSSSTAPAMPSGEAPPLVLGRRSAAASAAFEAARVAATRPRHLPDAARTRVLAGMAASVVAALAGGAARPAVLTAARAAASQLTSAATTSADVPLHRLLPTPPLLPPVFAISMLNLGFHDFSASRPADLPAALAAAAAAAGQHDDDDVRIVAPTTLPRAGAGALRPRPAVQSQLATAFEAAHKRARPAPPLPPPTEVVDLIDATQSSSGAGGDDDDVEVVVPRAPAARPERKATN